MAHSQQVRSQDETRKSRMCVSGNEGQKDVWRLR